MREKEEAKRGGKDRRVLLLVETHRQFGRGVLEGVARYRREVGNWYLSIEERCMEGGLRGWAREWRGDGILLGTRDRAVAVQVAGLGVPTVCLGEVVDSGFPTVHSNDTAVGRLGAQHLKGLGLLSLGYLGLRGVGRSTTREAAFRAVVRQAGWECSVMRLGDEGIELRKANEIGGAVLHWMRGMEKPCGVMGYSDLVGLRLIELCREGGLRVPSEVAVLGVGNDSVLCELCEPPLSSVQNDWGGIGYAGAELLDLLMGGHGVGGRTVTVEPVGVVGRCSTDVAASVDPRVGRALKFIGESACDGIAVADVLRVAGGPRRHFASTFRRLVGHGPKEAILRVQFCRVQELLRTTDYKLSHIAEECGFEHMEHMAAAFKRRLGVTPGEYRARHRPEKARRVSMAAASGDGHREGAARRRTRDRG